MLKIEVVKQVDADNGAGWTYMENPQLRRIIEWALQEPLEGFVHRLLVKTCCEIGEDVSEAENFWVSVVYSGEPKLGFCYHRNRETGELGVMPDLRVGFANDVSDFAESIVHEALHALGWGEQVVEAKAVEIVRNLLV